MGQPPLVPSSPQSDPASSRNGQDADTNDLDLDKINSVINYESGGDPSRRAARSSAGGLIQFMPDVWKGVAQSYGTPNVTHEQMLGMTKDQQMPYVKQYLKDRGITKDSSLGDYYLAVAAPALMGKPDDAVAYQRGSKAVDANPAWDTNKDGQVTAGELRSVLASKNSDSAQKQFNMEQDVKEENQPMSVEQFDKNLDAKFDPNNVGKAPLKDPTNGFPVDQRPGALTPEQQRALDQGATTVAGADDLSTLNRRRDDIDKQAQDIERTRAQNEFNSQNAQAGIDQQRTAAESDLLSRQQNDRANLQMRDQSAREDIQAKREAHVKEFQALTDKPPTGKIDADHWLANAPVGKKIMHSLAALGAGWIGKPEIVTNAIDRDIAVQRANVENAKQTWQQKLSAKNDLVGMINKERNDLDESTAIADSFMTKRTLGEAQRIAAVSQNSAAKLAATNLIPILQDRLNTINVTYADKKLQKDQALNTKQAEAGMNVFTLGDKKYQMTGLDSNNKPILVELGKNPASKGLKFNTDQSRLLATNNDAKIKLAHIAKLRGFVPDPNNPGLYMMGSSKTNMLLPKLLDKQNAEIDQNVDSIAPVIGMIQGGGLKPHDEEVHAIKDGLKSKSNNVALAALNSHLAALKNVIEGVNQYPGGHDQGDSQSGQYAPESGTE